MKKILLSLGSLVAVTAVVAGGTFAFYNDTETSRDNIFTAGSIDLKVDHTKMTYNGEECESGDCVVDENTTFIGNGSFENPVVTHEAGWDFFPDEYPGLVWRVGWEPGPNSYLDANRPAPALQEVQAGYAGYLAQDGTQFVELDSDWDGPSGTFNGEPALIHIYQDIPTVPAQKYVVRYYFSPRPGYSASQNTLLLRIDGLQVDSVSASGLALSNTSWSAHEFVFTAVGATTRVEFAGGGANDSIGAFIDNVRVHPMDCTEAITNGQCELWDEKDLEGDEQFFNFGDVKPGDRGSNVISLHVFDNDAWACLIVHDGVDGENDILDPEADAGDESEDEGELSDDLYIFSWGDDGDGIYEPGSPTFETGLIDEPTPLSELGSLASFDSLNGSYLAATTTAYIGLAWCAGEMTLEGGSIVCDGDGMGNAAQSDSFLASLTAYVEQKRNNDDFECSAVDLGTPPEGDGGPQPG